MNRTSVKLGIAGVVAACAMAPMRAHAFCGFYVAPDNETKLTADASMVALMREGSRTVISMSSNYKGPAKDFAMVVPVPVVLHQEDVKTLDNALFDRLEAISAPRLVEYWEQDPCFQPKYESDGMPTMAPMAATSETVAIDKRDGDYGVKVAARFSVGEYDIVILDAKASDGLEAWLHDHGYKIPDGAAEALAPYIHEQQKFFVAKVDVKKVKMDAQGVAVLSPLRFAYESQDFRLPVRLGLLNAPSGSTSSKKQDLLVFVLAKSKRYELANYPNVFAPTNIELAEDARPSFPAIYTALFDAAVDRSNGHGIVTEYAWDTTWQCDPCTSEPLMPESIATLGGDVLYQGQVPAITVTRLHARYDRSTLGEDLVFRAADPMRGGQEQADWKQNEKSARPSADEGGGNTFQARYVIRHPWKGPIECETPRRGVWGGPPAGTTGEAGIVAAKNLAAVPRGEIDLRHYLREPFVDYVIAPPRGVEKPHACGCEVPGAMTGAGGAIGVGAIGATIAAMARRRRKGP